MKVPADDKIFGDWGKWEKKSQNSLCLAKLDSMPLDLGVLN